ncbi:MAG: DinB family protein [Armatimonadota bacterium]|nr:DinB family protein [Armatimonadota bacterium]MDR7452533.1 DinB family protein [Armatimonadota bacterium]MDR7467760.1 DinB family protein [Armatimonadota bacterium]MDR7494960.1 DinB family protein [Armatimonadota bacterium]MDR7499775.1 DinB family protein [Armatimonadota bacterium]
MIDFAHAYDVLSRARETLFDWIRPLDQARYTQAFPFGLHTLRRTMVEIAAAEGWLAMRIREEPFPVPFDWEEWPISERACPTFAALEAAWRLQMPQTRATLAAITEPGRIVENRMVGRRRIAIYRAAQGDLAMQLLMHEVHHRAQAMAMLRQFGIEAQDLDYIGFAQTVQREPRAPQMA